MKNRKMYAQGDVLIVTVDKIPAKAVPVGRENGRVVLAHGEVTGHAHAISSRKATLMRFQNDLYLEAGGGVTLKHEEHGVIEIPQGTYRVVKQREYQFGQAQRVAD